MLYDFNFCFDSVVIQRYGPEVSDVNLFKKTYAQYQEGFYDGEGNLWMGLTEQHFLTQTRDCALRVDLQDWDDARYHASYQSYKIGPKSTGFKLHIKGFDSSSSLGDSLNYLDGARFSTYDKDQDDLVGSCAEKEGAGGGWWFKRCSHSVLNNGKYGNYNDRWAGKGIYWYAGGSKRGNAYQSWKASRMVLSCSAI